MDEYLRMHKSKKKGFKTKSNEVSKNKILSKYLTIFMLAIIFFLASIIFTNVSDKNLLLYKEYVLTESLPFTKIKGWYEDLFGEVLPKNDNTQTVFDGKLVYKEISDYLDGERLTISSKSLVNSLASGVVVFSGEKEGYGNTVIIQGIDGADIWYGNLENVSINLYDYIEANTVIGNVVDEYLYLVIKKDNEYIKYEDYQN